MNTHITAHKAEIRHQWFFLILCFHLVYAGVPGPCKHSVTQGHLLNLRRLIKNQLQNGCLITYSFTERQNLSVVCYIKAAFPHILDLLNTQFIYDKDSDNYRYTNSLMNVIYNIYSQGCIPSINEEIENSPAKFVRIHMTLARAALVKAEEVIRMYMDLMTKSDDPVNWNCEEEYTEDYPESTTEPLDQSPGVSECPCTCPAAISSPSKMPFSTSQWNVNLKSTPLPQRSSGRTKQLHKTEVKHRGAKSNPVPTLSSRTPATLKPTVGDLHSFLLGSVPISMDKTSNSVSKMEHTLSLGVSPSFTKSKELPDFSPGGTDFSLQSTVPGPYRRDTGDSIQNSVERSTAILLAKRSLDSKSQKGSFYSHNLLQTWVTTTSHPKVDLKTAAIGMAPVAKEKLFQNLQMSKHMVPVTSTVLKTAVHLSKHLTTTVEQLSHLNSPPENSQTHTQTLAREPRHLIKTPETKYSRSQEDKQEIHTPEDRQDKGTQRNSTMTETSSTILFFASALIITLACGGVLLITVLFYRQQKVSDQICLFVLNKTTSQVLSIKQQVLE
ncbi:macrophage colony-stimulating factor 1a [Triplophysa rosa]|uniref:Macrophage colony-stimulating factor-a n=1 Tax=Triplophysa rosa TaxID=992332 RepID=A0A9W7WEW6_TRIRA|nr:macrophage colony-stimulating factor 1a [Triplophysa rosa]XP_057218875.1 macrophage colony-stimulating factor 1a [Triplophysa rosa]KAI7795213.1 macrophage colony-stimulating factor-a precursor [Triplophysa rosa]